MMCILSDPVHALAVFQAGVEDREDLLKLHPVGYLVSVEAVLVSLERMSARAGPERAHETRYPQSPVRFNDQGAKLVAFASRDEGLVGDD